MRDASIFSRAGQQPRAGVRANTHLGEGPPRSPAPSILHCCFTRVGPPAGRRRLAASISCDRPLAGWAGCILRLHACCFSLTVFLLLSLCCRACWVSASRPRSEREDAGDLHQDMMCMQRMCLYYYCKSLMPLLSCLLTGSQLPGSGTVRLSGQPFLSFFCCINVRRFSPVPSSTCPMAPRWPCVPFLD